MLISVKVVPNSRKPSVDGSDGNYRVKIDAMPRENAANVRLIELLAAHFKVSKSSIRIVRGMRSRVKSVEIIGI